MWGTVNVLGNKISYENGTGKAREVSWISKDNGNGGSGPLLPKECANLFSSSPKASELMAWHRQAAKQKLPWNPKMYHKAHCLIVRDMLCCTDNLRTTFKSTKNVKRFVIHLGAKCTVIELKKIILEVEIKEIQIPGFNAEKQLGTSTSTQPASTR